MRDSRKRRSSNLMSAGRSTFSFCCRSSTVAIRRSCTGARQRAAATCTRSVGVIGASRRLTAFVTDRMSGTVVP